MHSGSGCWSISHTPGRVGLIGCWSLLGGDGLRDLEAFALGDHLLLAEFVVRHDTLAIDHEGRGLGVCRLELIENVGSVLRESDELTFDALVVVVDHGVHVEVLVLRVPLAAHIEDDRHPGFQHVDAAVALLVAQNRLDGLVGLVQNLHGHRIRTRPQEHGERVDVGVRQRLRALVLPVDEDFLVVEEMLDHRRDLEFDGFGHNRVDVVDDHRRHLNLGGVRALVPVAGVARQIGKSLRLLVVGRGVAETHRRLRVLRSSVENATVEELRDNDETDQ